MITLADYSPQTRVSTRRRNTLRRRNNAYGFRRNKWFRLVVAFLTLQTFVLVMVALFLDNDTLREAVAARNRNLKLLHEYVHKYEEWAITAPKGIIVDDEYDQRHDGVDRGDVSLRDDDLHQMEDHIANQTEQHLLESDVSRNRSHKNLEPIDNYYSRKHSTEQSFDFLVIGGSDGSGTRAFVTALGNLGVPMIVDDRRTMDVHGKPLFHGKGWPPLVSLVLNHTRSANYEVSDLPDHVVQIVLDELSKLKANFLSRGKRHVRREKNRKLEHHIKPNHYENKESRQRHPTLHNNPYSAFRHPGHRFLMEDNAKSKNYDIEDAAVTFEAAKADTEELLHMPNSARSVHFGWKAPISMLLLPFLREVFGRIKFLHVVRDGRDVALSANQSPVRKFYNVYYGEHIDTNKTSNLRAMQLWNDWNTEVLEYERAHAGSDFDYLVMRTEDLLNPETKFAALQQLANFVGSQNTLQDLCCQSQQAIVDMGHSSGSLGAGLGGQHHSNRRQHTSDQNTHVHLYDEFAHRTNPVALRNPVELLLAGGGHHDHHKHREMGGDPVLGYIHGGNDDHVDTHFDFEHGRHTGWHHGQMDAGAILEKAKANRMNYIQSRHKRFKGLQNEVTNHIKRHHPLAGHHRDVHTEGELEQQKEFDSADRSPQYHDIARSRHARDDHVDEEHHRRHDKGETDLMLREEHAGRTDEINRHHGHFVEQERVQRKLRSIDIKMPEEQGLIHRQLLESPNHHSIERPRSDGSVQQSDQNDESRRARKRRQFKPRRPDGEDKLFRPLRSKRNDTPRKRREREQNIVRRQDSGQEGQRNVQDVGQPTKPSSSGLSFLGTVEGKLGLNDGPESHFDEAIQGQFDKMSHMSVADSIKITQHLLGYNEHEEKKQENVKERYGKWVSYLGDNPELSIKLHQTGADGLRLFGYGPSVPFLDSSGIDHDFQCDDTVVCQTEE